MSSEKAKIGDRRRVNKYQRGLRAAALAYLGNKCASPNCRWLNLDGSLGCTDSSILQIDHIAGGGNKERAVLKPKQQYKKILAGSVDYQLLCANCNWLKRVAKGEDGGNHG
jgi:hypothetical protein